MSRTLVLWFGVGMLCIGLGLTAITHREPPTTFRPHPRVVLAAEAREASAATTTDSRAPRLETTPAGRESIVLQSPPSITAAKIDRILAAAGSSAAGTGPLWMAAGEQYGINPAIALAFFAHESSYAKAPGWAGWKSNGSHTYNIGNIICAGTSPYWSGKCWGRFRDYSDEPDPWKAGIYDWFELISKEYIGGRGHRVVADVTPVYAPWLDNNNPTAYGNRVDSLVVQWWNEDHP